MKQLRVTGNDSLASLYDSVLLVLIIKKPHYKVNKKRTLYNFTNVCMKGLLALL